MKRIGLKPVILIIIALMLVIAVYEEFISPRPGPLPLTELIDAGPRCEVPLLIGEQDRNNNDKPDALDLVAGARAEVERATRYDDSYYAGGYPPEGKGACTDVIWRAFAEGGYDLKSMLDEDIKENSRDYGATGQDPDPSIDFRRVKNLVVFFTNYGEELTIEVKAGDVENLKEWQPGDIVTFGLPYEHIGIVSDQRLRNGIPLVIHNGGPVASEANVLQTWPSEITHHFRYLPAEG